MSAEKITAKILADAQAEAQKIREEAQKRAKEIISRAKKEVGQITEEAQKEAQAQAVEEKKRVLSRAEMEVKRGSLKEKQVLIGKVFELALQRVEGMKGGEYSKLMEDLLLKAVEDGDEEVIISEETKGKLGGGFLERVNQRLRTGGKKGGLSLAEENRQIGSGFILRKGKKEVNCSFESLLGSKREELEGEVARILFS